MNESNISNNANTFHLHPQLARDSFVLGDLELSRLLLINDEQFPWCVLVPRRSNIQDIYQLTEVDQKLLWQESSQLSNAMMSIFKGEKMNIAALGNMVPQLHVHHIVRYKNDKAWPKPIWGEFPMVPYSDKKAQDIEHKIAQELPQLNVKRL